MDEQHQIATLRQAARLLNVSPTGLGNGARGAERPPTWAPGPKRPDTSSPGCEESVSTCVFVFTEKYGRMCQDPSVRHQVKPWMDDYGRAVCQS